MSAEVMLASVDTSVTMYRVRSRAKSKIIGRCRVRLSFQAPESKLTFGGVWMLANGLAAKRSLQWRSWRKSTESRVAQ
jgi:hypothetical protein